MIYVDFVCFENDRPQYSKDMTLSQIRDRCLNQDKIYQKLEKLVANNQSSTNFRIEIASIGFTFWIAVNWLRSKRPDRFMTISENRSPFQRLLIIPFCRKAWGSIVNSIYIPFQTRTRRLKSLDRIKTSTPSWGMYGELTVAPRLTRFDVPKANWHGHVNRAQVQPTMMGAHREIIIDSLTIKIHNLYIFTEAISGNFTENLLRTEEYRTSLKIPWSKGAIEGQQRKGNPSEHLCIKVFSNLLKLSDRETHKFTYFCASLWYDRVCRACVKTPRIFRQA